MTASRPWTPSPTTALGRQLNLTRELAVTQFKLKYTGSVLGYLWSLVKPLLIFAIYWVVFAKLLKVGQNQSPRFHFTLQLLIGIVLWSFFAETIGGAVGVIAANGGLIKKAYFPRPILVIASSLSAFMTFLINLTLIIVIAAPLHQMELGTSSLLLIPLVIELYVLILGLSLLLSSLFVFYRDLGHIWEIGSQVLFYASAVVYPLTMLHKYAQLAAINPMAQIIEDVRRAIVTDELPWTASLLGPGRGVMPFVTVVIIVVAGYSVFRALTPRFAEYL